jgi:hypothetical protein
MIVCLKVTNVRITYQQKDEEPDFEMSEIQMYHVNVLEEAGDYKKALNFLEEQKFRILDKTSWKEKRGEIHVFKIDLFACSTNKAIISWSVVEVGRLQRCR